VKLVLDGMHPLHGCDHYKSPKSRRWKIFRSLPLPIKKIIKIIFRRNLLDAPVYKSFDYQVQSKSYHANNASLSSIMDFYHPMHGCKHQYEGNYKTVQQRKRVLKLLPYDQRQIVKRFLPPILEKMVRNFLRA
jgi:hypothetical protein